MFAVNAIKLVTQFLLQRPAGQPLPIVSSVGIANQYPAIASGLRAGVYTPVTQAPQLSAEDRKVLPRKVSVTCLGLKIL